MFHRVGWRAFRPVGVLAPFAAAPQGSRAPERGIRGGGARSLRPCCLTAGRFAIADTCSYRLPDGSAPLLPVLAVDRSRPLRSRAPRPVTSPSAVGRPDAPPSRGEPGTPPAALAPLPPSAWRLAPPPASAAHLAVRPHPRSARLCRPARWACGGGRARGDAACGWRVGGAFEGGCGCFWPFSLWFTQAGVPIGAKRQGLLSVFPGQWNWPIAARSFSSVKHSEIGQKLAMGRQVPHRMGLGRSLGAVASDGGRPHLLLEPPPPAFAMSWGPPASCPLSSACSAVIRASPEPPPPRFRRSPGVSPLPQCPPCPPRPVRRVPFR